MSGTKGSSGFGSQSKEHIDKRTEIQKLKSAVITLEKNKVPVLIVNFYN